VARKLQRPKRSGDFAQQAKLAIDIATGQAPPDAPPRKETRFVKRARKGGLKGGKARAEKLTPEQRADIARVAAAARWKKVDS
jgi:hypothetical protein